MLKRTVFVRNVDRSSGSKTVIKLLNWSVKAALVKFFWPLITIYPENPVVWLSSFPPQIPALLAYFIPEDQRQYLVQKYIEGENREQELNSLGVFNEAKIRALLADLLPVLGFIHQRGVIHRDIKPENIIRRKQDNKLVLVDFGAAKAITPANRSVTGTVIGSAAAILNLRYSKGFRF